MAALVDYTALTEAQGFKDTFPVCAATPVDGIKKDFWRKVRVDFSLTNILDADWAKIAVIPAHTYVFDTMVHVLQLDAAASDIVVGFTNANLSDEFLHTQAGTGANVVWPTLVNADAGATRGHYFHTAGALYLSGATDWTTLIVDVYIHCMTMDQL